MVKLFQQRKLKNVSEHNISRTWIKCVRIIKIHCIIKLFQYRKFKNTSRLIPHTIGPIINNVTWIK